MYKNWKEICKMGPVDWCLMMALAHADMKTPTGRRLKEAFPKCFSLKKRRGPVPLSLLQEEAVKSNKEQMSGYDEAPEEAIASLEVLEKFEIPYKRFSTTRENFVDYGYPLIPEEIAEKCNFKSVVTFEGREYLVIEHILDEACLVPAECVWVDSER
ncbi:MAG: hypothetical protein Q7R93_00495 [bacterium]|nr:hypothetical protein [bacterium]